MRVSRELRRTVRGQAAIDLEVELQAVGTSAGAERLVRVAGVRREVNRPGGERLAPAARDGLDSAETLRALPRLLLIYPGNPDIAEKHRGKRRPFPAIGLPIIANLTPRDWEVTLVDEEIGRPIDLAAHDPDLVGISSMTSQAARAYALGDAWRRRGVTVVYGGAHPSVGPDEAALQAPHGRREGIPRGAATRRGSPRRSASSPTCCRCKT